MARIDRFLASETRLTQELNNPPFIRLLTLMREAGGIRIWNSNVVPGLLQTNEYGADQWTDKDPYNKALGMAVALRNANADEVRERGVRVSGIIAERALEMPHLATRNAKARQLEQLISATDPAADWSLRVVPDDVLEGTDKKTTAQPFEVLYSDAAYRHPLATYHERHPEASELLFDNDPIERDEATFELLGTLALDLSDTQQLLQEKLAAL